MRDSILKALGIGALLVGLGALCFWYLQRQSSTAPVAPITAPVAPITAPVAPVTPPSAAASPPVEAAPQTTLPLPAAAEPSLNAQQLTERAKAQLALDPAAALRDIEQADKLAGAADETRRVVEIHAFVRLGKVGHARTLTDHFYRDFPDSAHAGELERLTGYHPRPQGPGRP
jgi:hypothetical protein